MLVLLDEDANIDNLQKSIRINKYEYGSWVKGISHRNKNKCLTSKISRMKFDLAHGKKKKRNKMSSLNLKI